MLLVSWTQTDLSFLSKLTLLSCSFLPTDKYWLPYQKWHLPEHLWAHPQLLWCCTELNLLSHGKGLFSQVSEVRSVQGTGEEAPGQKSEEMAPVSVRKKHWGFRNLWCLPLQFSTDNYSLLKGLQKPLSRITCANLFWSTNCTWCFLITVEKYSRSRMEYARHLSYLPNKKLCHCCFFPVFASFFKASWDF